MAPPFAETTPAWIYVTIGVLATLALISVSYIIYLHRRRIEDSEDKEVQGQNFRIDNIGLSKKAEDLLEQVMDQPELQNELPQKLDVSKATVSNAVSELKDRGLIIRKKKGNTYLIEQDEEEIENQQR